MTRGEGVAWKRRWELVNEYERDELRRTHAEEKLRQWAVMLSAAREMGWADQLAEGEEQVRARWIRIRELARGRS